MQRTRNTAPLICDVNCLANTFETNSIVNFAENCFERFYVTLRDGICHMLWKLESISHPRNKLKGTR